MLTFLDKYRDFAPTITRLILGCTLLFAHGLPKVLTPDRWERTGQAMASIGVTFAPVFWGFMAGAMEVLGGVLFIIGLAVRPMAAVQVFIMIVAAARSLSTGAGLEGGNAHPIDFAAGALGLLILGAGAYSLDRKFGFERQKKDERVSSAAPAARAV